MKKILLLSAIVFTCALIGFAAQKKETPNLFAGMSRSPVTEQHIVLTPPELQWGEAPPSLPPGAKLAVLSGDPMGNGNYTVRLRVPAGYRIPPHTHPTAENVTVISGTMFFAAGAKFDETAGKELPAGGYAMMPAGMQHYAWTKAGSILQLHGMGPFQITYVNASDDPRNAKK